jgi:hypothetical protein
LEDPHSGSAVFCRTGDAIDVAQGSETVKLNKRIDTGSVVASSIQQYFPVSQLWTSE